MQKTYISVNGGTPMMIKKVDGSLLAAGDIKQGELVRVFPEELLLTTIDKDFRKWFESNVDRKGSKAKGELLAWIKNLIDIAYRKGLRDAKK